jgi:hypothetical protein
MAEINGTNTNGGALERAVSNVWSRLLARAAMVIGGVIATFVGSYALPRALDTIIRIEDSITSFQSDFREFKVSTEAGRAELKNAIDANNRVLNLKMDFTDQKVMDHERRINQLERAK